MTNQNRIDAERPPGRLRASLGLGTTSARALTLRVDESGSAQTRPRWEPILNRMEANKVVRIVTLERLNFGVVVQFANGIFALYTDKLLYDMLPAAQLLDEGQVSW